MSPPRLAMLIALAWTATVRGAPLESFDTPGRSWQLRDRDAPLRMTRHERVFDTAHAGSGSELLEFQADQGTYVHFAHSLPASRVHPELTTVAWVKADRPGVQLLVRVVLPRSIDPRSGQPVTILVPGEVYAQAGRWQQLRVTNISIQVQRQIRALRARSQQPLDETESYVDLAVINAYQAAGLNRVWIDDLDVVGHVRSRSPALSAALRAQRTTVDLRSDVVLIDQVPRFLRMVRHRGEPLELLKRLGFNTVYSDAPASATLLAEAQAQQMWVVAAAAQAPLGDAADRLVAWTTGPMSLGNHEPVLLQRTALARASQPIGRPVAGDFQHIGSSAKHVDILLLGRATRNSSIAWPRYRRWLSQQRQQGRLRTPLWVRVELDASPHWQQQMEAFGLDSLQRLTPSWAQLRTEAISAVSTGARGVLVDTRLPLHTSPSGARASMARLLNLELQLLEPWFSGGEFGPLPHPNEDLRITQVITERSRLLIAIRHASHQEQCEGAAPLEELSIVAPARGGSTPGFRISRGKVEPLRTRRVPGGLHVKIEKAEPLEVIALSQDPLVLNHLSRQLSANAEDRARLLSAIAFQRLGLTAEVDRRLSDSQAPGDPQPLQRTRALLNESRELIETGKFEESSDGSRQVLRQLAEMRRRHWERETTGLDPNVSPALLSFDTLPLHRLMRQRTADGRWSGNLLGGGNLEDRASVEQSGWGNRRGAAPMWHTDVSFAHGVAKAGNGCLRLSCVTTDIKGRPPAESPIVILSPAVPMRLGQIVRVSGWVRVPKPLKGLDGLLIHDSLGGRDLALRVHEAAQWTRFEFYRVASDARPMTVAWELTEAGEVWIDEVSINVHQGLGAPSPAIGRRQGAPQR